MNDPMNATMCIQMDLNDENMNVATEKKKREKNVAFILHMITHSNNKTSKMIKVGDEKKEHQHTCAANERSNFLKIEMSNFSLIGSRYLAATQERRQRHQMTDVYSNSNTSISHPQSSFSLPDYKTHTHTHTHIFFK